MKKKIHKTDPVKSEPEEDLNDEVKEFIRRKNIQNRILKEIIEKMKNS